MAGRVEEFTARWFACITTTSVTTDLTTHADSPANGYGTATTKEGRCCRAIHVLTAGTGTVALTQLDGTQETITGIKDNTLLAVQATNILPASDFTSVLVLW